MCRIYRNGLEVLCSVKLRRETTNGKKVWLFEKKGFFESSGRRGQDLSMNRRSKGSGGCRPRHGNRARLEKEELWATSLGGTSRHNKKDTSTFSRKRTDRCERSSAAGRPIGTESSKNKLPKSDRFCGWYVIRDRLHQQKRQAVQL